MNTVRLSKVAKIDRTVASKADCQILPYVGLEHLEKESGQFIPSFRARPDTNLLAAKFRFTPKHILYGKLRPYLNKVIAPTFSGVCTTEILPILPDPTQLSRGYLYAILRSPKFVEWASAAVSGANLPRLDPKQLAHYEIPFPSLPEQKRIAAILDKADRLRRQRRFAQTLSDSFLQSVFIKMFGDPVSNSMNWDAKHLNGLCRNITDGTHHTPERVKKGVPFITSKNVRPFRFDLSNLEFVSEETHAEIIKRCNPINGDVLYTNIGVNVGNAVLNNLRYSFSLKNVALLQPDKTRLNGYFLESLLNFDKFKNNLIDISSQGGAQKFISLEILRSIYIFAPPLPLQEKFAAIVQKFERIRRQQREATRQAEHLFQTLLHRAFRGEL